MGILRRFDLKPYIDDRQLIDFIETGTWRGDAIEYALSFGFRRLYTIELLEEYYNKCVNRFERNENVILYHDNSINGLLRIFKEEKIGNCLFWLDAHLPDFYDNSYKNNYNENKKILIPLEEEIKVIVENKDVTNDVFICDDLRIYEKGPFAKGEWHGVMNAGINGIEFIHKLLGKTHDIQKNYNDEGYIICLPK